MDFRNRPSGDYNWILHVKDHFSKFSMLYPLKRKEAIMVCDCLEQFIKHYDIPDIIQCDNGREFAGAVLMLCRRLGIKVINGKPRTPRTQGLVEQANGVAKTKIASWITETGNSQRHLALTEVSKQMNRQSHDSLPTKWTPDRVFALRKARPMRSNHLKPTEADKAIYESISEQEINQHCREDAPDPPENVQMALKTISFEAYGDSEGHYRIREFGP